MSRRGDLFRGWESAPAVKLLGFVPTMYSEAQRSVRRRVATLALLSDFVSSTPMCVCQEKINLGNFLSATYLRIAHRSAPGLRGAYQAGWR